MCFAMVTVGDFGRPEVKEKYEKSVNFMIALDIWQASC